MFTLSRKMALFRNFARKWCLQHKRVWGINWTSTLASLKDTSSDLLTISKGVDFLADLAKVEDSMQIHFHFWRQRLKENWLLEGDTPSKLLFSRVKTRRKRNCILTLKNSSGVWEEGQAKIESMIVDNLKSILKSDSIHLESDEIELVFRELDLPRLSEDQLLLLNAPITLQEVRQAMYSIPNPRGQMV